ncbi:hypothetical protein L227DRAFT_497657 [Lentinus tigrinus ALCF2SS1-6]|uniref:PHD-type domain-containing protein n=1 Tax=Lentinus tigrinus ALCF2SS1-6 TaxID=1328759 RepID=A0A5C2SGT5_9APHY|nr:hypothetical protein L227DRAFT_497657 [Lentinus tigrinus ALCF2SS1-6]
MPPQVVHRLSHHEGKSRHSRVENRHQDDPHEWLLEHFADSPVCDSHRSSAAPEEPPQTPYISDGSPQPPVEKDSPKPPVSPPSKRAKRPKKKVPSPSRSPTPTALLEQELDGISAEHDEVDIPHAPRSPRSDADTDFGFEFDLAAGAAPDRDVDPDISMGNELDDELLSLVDDQPRHSHSHSHSYHAPSTKASRMSTATTRHEKPASVRDSVAKTSVAAAIPPPPPAPILLTAVSPSLTSPTTQADKPVASQTLSKREKAKVEGLSASMKNKEPAPKAQEKAQEKPKPKPKPRPVAKPKVKVTGEKDNTAGSSGRLTPSSSGTVAKGKGKKSAAVNAAVVAKRGISAATGPSRSRSASEMPMPAEPQPKVKPPPPPQHEEEEASEEEAVDDKLYCICKTSYDEDKVMIACDRCDEWYHTQCLNINDLEVDLIDQFVCPPCVMANPNLPLKTTYKARCLAGLKHPHPSSPDACHKPARGAFSKFCSDECGIAYMQRRIEGWGGSHAVLWASVKDTKQREGVVVKVQVLGSPDEVPQEEKRPGATVGHLIQEAHEVQQPTKTQRDRKISRLQAQLDKLAPKREEVKRDLEVILWREKLLHLATVRADSLRNECGWDQRLCMDDEDYADYGGVVLESYEEGHAQSNGVDAMQVDATLEAGEWWCRGVKKCPRHAGWQKLRASEFDFDRKAKEEAISAMTAKEREIRGQLEDAISLPVRQMVISAPPLQLLNDHQPNGVKAKPNGTSGRKGKQKN